jgi:hypothetical protein
LDVPSLTAISQTMMSVAWTASTAAGGNHSSPPPIENSGQRKTAKKS